MIDDLKLLVHRLRHLGSQLRALRADQIGVPAVRICRILADTQLEPILRQARHVLEQEQKRLDETLSALANLAEESEAEAKRERARLSRKKAKRKATKKTKRRKK
jgi:vacuolar-type H+-ATPase subunit I/STV1